MKKSGTIKSVVIKLCVVAIFLTLTTLPLLMMYYLSQSEQENYVQNQQYVYKEAAYGAPVTVKREDVEQYYTFDGYFTNSTYEFIPLESNAEDADIRTLVGIGDEVIAGDLVAYVGDREVRSDHNGIVEEIMSYAGGYLKLRSLERLELVCKADKNIASKVKNCDSLRLEDGRKVTVKRASNIVTDQQITIVFEIKDGNYMYGEEVNGIKIYTGRVFNNVLVVDKNAVYQKNDGKYYVRTLNDQFYFEREVEVEVGFETEEVMGITNVEEGTLCDSGYKYFFETDQGAS